jgi:hypothetical protein
MLKTCSRALSHSSFHPKVWKNNGFAWSGKALAADFRLQVSVNNCEGTGLICMPKRCAGVVEQANAAYERSESVDKDVPRRYERASVLRCGQPLA